MDAGRRCETLGSEMNSLITGGTVSNVNFMMVPPCFSDPHEGEAEGPKGATQRVCCCVQWVCLATEDSRQGNQNLLQRASSKHAIAHEPGIKNYTGGTSWWCREVKTLIFQCRGCAFNSWSGMKVTCCRALPKDFV